MRQLGGKSPVTLAEFAKAARLKDRPGQRPNARAMPTALLVDHEAVIMTLRTDLATAMDKFGDTGTSDLLTGLMEKHEKMAWMLRAFLEA